MKRYHCHRKMKQLENGYNGHEDHITVFVCVKCGLYQQYGEYFKK